MNDTLMLENIGFRIRHVRKDKRLTQDDFAQKIKISRGYLSEIESGKAEPSKIVRLAISNVFAVRDGWLLAGEGPIYDDRWRLLEERAQELGEDIYIKLKTAEREKDRYGELIETICAEGDEKSDYLSLEKSRYVYVPQVSGKISAGAGRVPEEDEEVRVAFRREWIRRKGEAKNMALIKVIGDSMEPTLLSGDLVLVDRGRSFISPEGGIYAVALDDVIMVKRVQVLHPVDKLRIISDNKKYDPIEVPADQVKINGKVIWYARELER